MMHTYLDLFQGLDPTGVEPAPFSGGPFTHFEQTCPLVLHSILSQKVESKQERRQTELCRIYMRIRKIRHLKVL
jgi:hypothetical protein